MAVEDEKPRKIPKQFLPVSKTVMKQFQAGTIQNVIAAGHENYKLGPIILINHADAEDQQHAFVSMVTHKQMSHLTRKEATAAGVPSPKKIIDILKRIPPEAGGIRGVNAGPTYPLTVVTLQVG